MSCEGQKNCKEGTVRTPRRFGVLGAVLTVSLFLPTSVFACAACICAIISDQILQQFITQQFDFHDRWVFNDFFQQQFRPAMQSQATQSANVSMLEVFTLGAFFDAKEQLERERLFQELKAKAHKDYHSSLEMCTLGTTAIGMAAAERNGEYNAFFLAQRSQDRQLGNRNSVSTEGKMIDFNARLEAFKRLNCDRFNNNGVLGAASNSMCDTAAKTKINLDVNYTRSIDKRLSLDVDFSDQTSTEDETTLIELQNNLFAVEPFNVDSNTVKDVGKNAEAYLDLRSVVAKRSVAENSFNTIVGMKTAGTPASANERDYAANVLVQLGWTLADARKAVGDKPSYYALMMLMSKKAISSPQFFANFYDTPANTRRKDAAMQAIGLMLDRDMYKSELRSEGLMALWLETELMKMQEDVHNRNKNRAPSEWER